MNNRIFIILFLLIIPFFAKGQEYSVVSFKIVPSDLTARMTARVDNDGRRCGLIKVCAREYCVSNRFDYGVTSNVDSLGLNLALKGSASTSICL